MRHIDNFIVNSHGSRQSCECRHVRRVLDDVTLAFAESLWHAHLSFKRDDKRDVYTNGTNGSNSKEFLKLQSWFAELTVFTERQRHFISAETARVVTDVAQHYK